MTTETGAGSSRADARSRDRWYKRLHWQIAMGMILGLIAGALGGTDFAARVDWLGTLFIRLLKMVIVPLVLTSIVSGVASVGGGRDLGRLFSKTLGYYVLTSGLAILAGLLAVNIIRPGEGTEIGIAEKATLPELSAPTSPIDVILDIVPENVIASAARMEMLPVIFFSIVLGMAIASLPEKPRESLKSFFDAAFQAMMRLTGGVIRFAPVGVFGLMGSLVGQTGFSTFRALALYAVTIFAGLTVHLFVTLPVVLIVLGRIRPWVHLGKMVEPLVMAFSTSSSGATLPVTLNAVENKVGVSNRISSFVLPMGATINMDGTALYECAGVLFIAQVLGQSLGFEQQLVVVFTALLASIGAAAVPSAGLIIIFIVLQAVNLTGPEVNLIVGAMLAVDRPLDMYRTAVNVYSDSCGAAIIARSEGETLYTAVPGGVPAKA